MTTQRPFTGDEIRAAYLRFFEERGHLVMPSASLIPAGDPTLLLTSAGMVPFKPYYSGDETPPNRRLASAQKCFRATDIDLVGDYTHHTMFEMLGNFSIGDYFKRETIRWAWEFFTEVLVFDPQLLWVTVHDSDDEAFAIWRDEVGVPEQHISRCGDADNFWGPAGDEGACGPSSEIHYDRHPGADPNATPCHDPAGRFVEIWNLVFPQFYQAPDGSRTDLPAPSIDTGMGLERVAAIIQDVPSAYETDLLAPIRQRVEQLSGRTYGHDPEIDYAIRVVTEHTRAAAFLLADGVTPSNEGRGYVLRRILRRAIYFYSTRLEGTSRHYMSQTARAVISKMSDQYPELLEHGELILRLTDYEEGRFLQTLHEARGYLEGISRFRRSNQDMFERVVANPALRADVIGISLDSIHDSTMLLADAPRALKRSVVDHFKAILGRGDEWWTAPPEQFEDARKQAMQLTGREVFVLADTYGFPSELSFEVAPEYGLEVTRDTFEGFQREMNAQRERGRAAARFGGARDLNRVYEALGAPPTAFVGYDALEANARVVGLLKDNEWAPVAEEGDEVDIVLDRTPFYAEGGGQVGDTGTIVAAGGTARVDDTQRPVGDFIAHRATVTSGSIAVGGEARAAVDRERRLDVMRNHTATHLLHAVLRDALGSHVRQAGSLVAPDRLRFDFTHVAAVSPAEIAEIERTVNERIRGDLGVVKREEAQRDALARGALAFFGERYGDTVRTVSIGEPGEANAEGPASFELCGGTHLDRTGQIGFFHVVSESSVGTGVRRIEAVTGRGSEAFIAGRLRALDEVAARLRSTADEAPQRVEALQAQVEEARRGASAGQRDASLREAEQLLTQAQDVNGVKVLAATSSAPDADALRTTGDWLRDKLGSAIVVLGGVFADRPSVIAMVTPDLVDRGFNAGDIVKAAAAPMGGGGGGRPQLAQAGGKEPGKLGEALEAAVASVRDRAG